MRFKKGKYIEISDQTILYSMLRSMAFTMIELLYICAFISDAICHKMGLNPYLRESNWVLYTVTAVYMLLKDLTYKKSIIKHIIRADIVDKNGDDAKWWQRIVRNIPLAIPFGYIVEIIVGLFFATLFDSPRRAGDFLAGTYVIPSSQRRAFKREIEARDLRKSLEEKGLLNNDDDIFELHRKRDESDHLQ